MLILFFLQALIFQQKRLEQGIKLQREQQGKYKRLLLLYLKEKIRLLFIIKI